ncbi:MAG: DUF928 domain-containing protein [Cyanobacteria bacterium]|nr:DUF928 domain-containing protein [Cyanobacteriota bacterium]
MLNPSDRRRPAATAPTKSTRRRWSTLLLAIATSLGSTLAAIAPATAQLVPNPQDRRTPTGTVGGGTRGNGCGSTSDMPFVNLSENPNAPGGVSFSVRDPNPLLYIHLPEERPADAEFIVLDGSGTILERSALTLPSASEPGHQVLALRLFADSGQGRGLSLEPQKSYRWAFVLICDREDRGADRGVLGEVRLMDAMPPAPGPTPRPRQGSSGTTR